MMRAVFALACGPVEIEGSLLIIDTPEGSGTTLLDVSLGNVSVEEVWTNVIVAEAEDVVLA
jgi:hypothetical protein